MRHTYWFMGTGSQGYTPLPFVPKTSAVFGLVVRAKWYPYEYQVFQPNITLQ